MSFFNSHFRHAPIFFGGNGRLALMARRAKNATAFFVYGRGARVDGTSLRKQA